MVYFNVKAKKKGLRGKILQNNKKAKFDSKASNKNYIKV